MILIFSLRLSSNENKSTIFNFIQQPTSISTGVQATFTFNRDTGIMKSYRALSSYCDQLWELTSFESTFTDIVSSSTTSSTSSEFSNSSSSISEESDGVGF